MKGSPFVHQITHHRLTCHSLRFLVILLEVKESKITILWDDYVTVTGRVRPGTGYRHECQTENLGPLTNQLQAPFLDGMSSFSQLDHTS